MLKVFTTDSIMLTEIKMIALAYIKCHGNQAPADMLPNYHTYHDKGGMMLFKVPVTAKMVAPGVNEFVLRAKAH